MYLSIIFILLNLFPVACTNNKKNIKYCQLDTLSKKDATIDSMLRNDPVVLDSVTVMLYTADELIERNGNPCRDSLFQIKDADRSRDFLWRYIPRDSAVIVRELRWELDSMRMLDIWYTKNDNIWQPVTYDFYLKGSEF